MADINIDERISFTLAFDEMFHGPEPVSHIKKIPSTPIHPLLFFPNFGLHPADMDTNWL